MRLLQTVKRRMGGDKEPPKTAAAPSSPRPANSEPNSNQKTEKAAVAKTTAKPQGSGDPYADLGKLRDAVAQDRNELFRKKLQVCAANVYDFHTDTKQKEKEAKRQTLLEMVEYVNNTRNCFGETLMADVVGMVSSNIFRSLPVNTRGPGIAFDPEEDEPALEPAWPHLQIVYEFFLRFVVSNDVDPKIAKRFVDHNFVLKLLELFDSEDPRERDYLKTILHRTYGKFMALRSFIRRAIQHTFYKVIYEGEQFETHCGIGELLEILGSIINGFALPLKQEHSDFLLMALIPLHKVKSLSSFYQQLSYCVAQFAEKDPRLCYEIITSLLQHWPVSMTSKQILFLNELEELLEMTQPPEFLRMMDPLGRRIALCITSPHFRVAERTLFLWNNEYIVKLINQNHKALFPIMTSALCTNTQNHWNSAVQALTANVLKLLVDADSQLVEECVVKHKSIQEEEEALTVVRDRKWGSLQELHDKSNRAA